MTLIVKELIVRGIVTSNGSSIRESTLDKENLLQLVEQIKKEIEKDCVDKVMQKLESKTRR